MVEKRMFMLEEPLFPISNRDSYMNPLPLTIHRKNSCMVDNFLGIIHSNDGKIFFISTITK